ncbi:unnamed protein product, partial [Rotaria sp. Silwood2]
KCSFNQERIWIDEQILESLIKTNEDFYNYNIVIVYKIEDGFLSIKILLNKHEIFETLIDYNIDEYCLKQTINKYLNNDNYSYELTSIDINDIEKINNIIYNQQILNKFDLNKDKIFLLSFIKTK